MNYGRCSRRGCANVINDLRHDGTPMPMCSVCHAKLRKVPPLMAARVWVEPPPVKSKRERRAERRAKKVAAKAKKAASKAANPKTARILVFGKKKNRSGPGGSYKDRNKHLARLGFADYGEYLSSSLWARVRGRAFAANGNKCHICRNAAVQIHHMWYGMSDLNGHRMCNLHPICRPCHEEVEHDDNGHKIIDFGMVRHRFDVLRAKRWNN